MIELTGSSLNLKQLKEILYKESGVSLNKEALERVKKSRAGGRENCPGRPNRLRDQYWFWLVQ